MKNKVYLCLIIVFLCFFNLNSAHTFDYLRYSNDNNNLCIGKDNISFTDSLKQKFIPIIQGVWVLTDYINEIEATQSPIKSMHKLMQPNPMHILDEIVTMVIDVTNQSDTINVGASINNHEEYYFTIYSQTGQNDNSLKTNISSGYGDRYNFYELSYKTINNVNYLLLYCYDKTNKLIGTRQFTKVADKQEEEDVAWGIQYIVNKKLLFGDFLLIDNENAKTQIKFTDDGSVKGFPEFKTYKIVTDFIGDIIFLEIDIILFRNDKGDLSEYAFQINKDTIYLYSIILHEETGAPFKLDELKYKLVRYK